MRRVTRTFRIPADLVERFDRVAEQMQIEKTSVVVEAIEQFVEKNEIFHALFDDDSVHAPAFIREEYLDEFDLFEGTKEEIFNEAYERSAKIVHLYEGQADEHDVTTFMYVTTLSNFNNRKEFEQ